MEFTKVISSPVFASSAPDIGLKVQNEGPVTLKVSTADSSWDIMLSPLPGPAADKSLQVTIRLRDILASVVTPPDPAETGTNSAVIAIPSVNLTASNDAGESASIDIPVAYGNINGKSPADFIGHWLTSREQICRTYTWARERLFLYVSLQDLEWSGPVSVEVRYKVYLADGSKEDRPLASTSVSDDYPNLYLSVDCSYERIISVIGDDKQLVAWDVYYTLSETVEHGTSLHRETSYTQRFILANRDDRVREFLFVNCFGMEDRVFGEGIAKRKIDGSASTFVNDGKTMEITNSAETVYEAFSGQLPDRRAVFHWHDFLSSSKRMILRTSDARLARIVVDSYDSETEDFAVGGVSFSYRLSAKHTEFPDGLCDSIGDYDPNQQFGALYVGDNPQVVIPTEEDLFFLKHRLSEFQTLTVSDALLLLVQSPATNAWGSINLGSLKQWLAKFIDTGTRSIRLNALSDYKTDKGTVIDPSVLADGSIPVWNAAAEAYRPVPVSELGQYGFIQTLYPFVVTRGDTVVLTYEPGVKKAVLDISGLASSSDLKSHVNNGAIHVSAAEKNSWNLVASLFGVDEDGNVYVKGDRGFYGTSFISSHGLDPEAGGAGGGLDVDELWSVLGASGTEKINVSHIPALGISAITGLQDALDSKLEGVTKGMVEAVLTGTVTSHDHDGRYAPLSGGLIPSQYLPGFVDDVLEYPSAASFPDTGESGKIYVALDTNLTYRWGGSGYVEISPSLALGHTSSTAYPGDEGAANAAAIRTLQGRFTGGAANKVAHSLTIVHDGGSTSASDKTFDGSAAVTVSIPTTLPASDVYAWAKAATKPSYTWGEIGGKPSTLEGYGITDGVNSVEAEGHLTASVSEHKLSVGVASGYAIPSGTQITLWDKIAELFDIDADGNVYVTGDRGFYSNSFVSARGSDPEAGSGAGGLDVDELWSVLGAAGTEKIDASHIPSLSQLSGTLGNAQLANSSVTIAGVAVALGGAVSTAQIASALTAAGYKLTDTIYTLPKATVSALGGIKAAGVRTSAITTTQGGTTSGRYYGVELDSNGKAFVNVPWVNTTYSLSSFGITATAAEINKLDGLATTATELGYVHGVTSAIQTQLNAKANASALASYALKDGSNASGTWAISVSGNAGTVGGYTAEQVARTMFYLPRVRLADVGWYRVFAVGSNFSDADGINILLHLSRRFNFYNNEAYTFSIAVAYNGGISITQLAGRANTRVVDKIRVVYELNVKGVLYVDFHIGISTAGNEYTVSGQGPGTFQTPTPVSETPANSVEFDTVNGMGSNLGFTGDLTGNAASATDATNLAGVAGVKYLYHFRKTGYNIDTVSTLNPRVLEINNPEGTPPTSNAWLQVLTWGSGDSGYGTQLANQYNIEGSLYFRNKVAGTWKPWKTLLDTANYATLIDSRYVKKSGDTMTGALTISTSGCPLYIQGGSSVESYLKVRLGGTDKSAFGYNSSLGTFLYSYTFGGYLSLTDAGLARIYKGSSLVGTLWHSGNDGSGSGLDADLLDGKNATSFTWSTSFGDSTDFNTVTQSGVYRFGFGYTNGPGYGYGQMLVLHGGGDTIAQIAVDYSASIVRVRAGNPADVGGTGSWTAWKTLAFTTDNVASATRLATARTLWGKPFNGTGNVSGDMTGVDWINGGLLVSTFGSNADGSDTVRLLTNGHNVEFGGPGYSHVTYRLRPKYGSQGSTNASLYIQNASASANPTFTTTHAFDANGNATHSGALAAGSSIISGGHLFMKAASGRFIFNSTGSGFMMSMESGNFRLASHNIGSFVARLAEVDMSGNVGIKAAPASGYALNVAGAGYFGGLLRADAGVQIGGTADIGWYNRGNRIAAGSSTARGVNVGDLLVSNAWADMTKVPTNGIYSKGAVLTDGYLQVGSGRLRWDAANDALYVEKSDGTACGLYSTGFLSSHDADPGAGTAAGADTGAAVPQYDLLRPRRLASQTCYEGSVTDTTVSPNRVLTVSDQPPMLRFRGGKPGDGWSVEVYVRTSGGKNSKYRRVLTAPVSECTADSSWKDTVYESVVLPWSLMRIFFEKFDPTAGRFHSTPYVGATVGAAWANLVANSRKGSGVTSFTSIEKKQWYSPGGDGGRIPSQASCLYAYAHFGVRLANDTLGVHGDMKTFTISLRKATSSNLRNNDLSFTMRTD